MAVLRPSRSYAMVVVTLAGAAVVSAAGFSRATEVTLPCTSWVNRTAPPSWSVVLTTSPSAFRSSVRVWPRALVWVVT